MMVPWGTKHIGIFSMIYIYIYTHTHTHTHTHTRNKFVHFVGLVLLNAYHDWLDILNAKQIKVICLITVRQR